MAEIKRAAVIHMGSSDNWELSDRVIGELNSKNLSSSDEKVYFIYKGSKCSEYNLLKRGSWVSKNKQDEDTISFQSFLYERGIDVDNLDNGVIPSGVIVSVDLIAGNDYQHNTFLINPVVEKFSGDIYLPLDSRIIYEGNPPLNRLSFTPWNMGVAMGRPLSEDIKRNFFTKAAFTVDDELSNVSVEEQVYRLKID